MCACAKKGCTKYVEVFFYSQLLFESAYLILDVLCCLRMCHVTSQCAEGMFLGAFFQFTSAGFWAFLFFLERRIQCWTVLNTTHGAASEDSLISVTWRGGTCAVSQEDMGFQCFWNNDQVPAVVDIPVVATSQKLKKMLSGNILTPAVVLKF